MPFGEILACVLFACWAALTAACNLLVSGDNVRRRDLLGLVPEWRFFAPDPIHTDFLLMYRHWVGEQLIGPWQQFNDIKQRTLWNPVWNPGKRANKALVDYTNDLIRTSVKSGGVLPATSLSYLALLNIVSAQPSFYMGARIQFGVLAQDRISNASSLVLLSFVHPIAESMNDQSGILRRVARGDR